MAEKLTLIEALQNKAKFTHDQLKKLVEKDTMELPTPKDTREEAIYYSGALWVLCYLLGVEGLDLPQ